MSQAFILIIPNPDLFQSSNIFLCTSLSHQLRKVRLCLRPLCEVTTGTPESFRQGTELLEPGRFFGAVTVHIW